MAHVAATSVARQLGSLFEGGSAAGLSDRQLLERFAASPRRGRLRGAGRAPRADGAGHLPPAPRRRPARRGRLPGRLPGPGPEGPLDPRPRPAGQLAVRRRQPDGASPAAQIARRRRREEDHAMRGPAAARAPRPSRRPRPPTGRPSTASRPRPFTREIDRLPASFAPAGGPLLLRGPHARRGRPPPPLPGRDGPQPAGPRQGEAPDRPGPTRGRLARRRAGAVLAPRSASASIPPLLCDSTTRAAIAFAARHAAASGALAAPAAALAQEVLKTMLLHKLRAHRDVLVAPRRDRHRRGICARSMPVRPAGQAAGEPMRRHPEGEPPGEPRCKRLGRSLARPMIAAPDRTARMTVAGRVLDPDGKPVKGAVVDLVTRRRSPRVGTSDEGDDLRAARPGPDRRRRAASASTHPAPPRPASSRSTPWPPRRGTASAGPS